MFVLINTYLSFLPHRDFDHHQKYIFYNLLFDLISYLNLFEIDKSVLF